MGTGEKKKSPLTTLCYLEQNGCYLMMHRIKKAKDVNEGKWIGIGGHFEAGESPEECLLREVREETGLLLTSWNFRGIVTFTSDDAPTEYMCLYTSDSWEGELAEECEEGVLQWIPKAEVPKLRLWEGDRVFLKLMTQDVPFFSLKLSYEKDRLTECVLNGRSLLQ